MSYIRSKLNGLTFLSLLVLSMTVLLWASSYASPLQRFVLAEEKVPTPNLFSGQTRRRSLLLNQHGALVYFQLDITVMIRPALPKSVLARKRGPVRTCGYVPADPIGYAQFIETPVLMNDLAKENQGTPGSLMFARPGHWGIYLPYWLPALLSIMHPVVWLLKWNRRRRLALIGKCSSCAYDLTGNLSGLCPECGAHTFRGRKQDQKILALNSALALEQMGDQVSSTR